MYTLSVLLHITYSKPKTERNIPDGIHAPIDSGMSNIHQIPQLRHHGAVYHSNRKAQAGVRNDQMRDLCGKRYLQVKEKKMVSLACVVGQLTGE